MYDCIVVGAGIEGSATAYFLAKKKHNTLLLEQVSIPGVLRSYYSSKFNCKICGLSHIIREEIFFCLKITGLGGYQTR